MRFEPPTIAQRGQLARTIAAVHARLDPQKDVTGRLHCCRCKGWVVFAIQKDGHSRGRCNSLGCLAWCH